MLLINKPSIQRSRVLGGAYWTRTSVSLRSVRLTSGRLLPLPRGILPCSPRFGLASSATGGAAVLRPIDVSHRWARWIPVIPQKNATLADSDGLLSLFSLDSNCFRDDFFTHPGASSRKPPSMCVHISGGSLDSCSTTKKCHPIGWHFFVVVLTGLEPVTPSM